VLDFIWMDNEVGHPRLGLVVPRYQQTAVARNRLRRRLKELWRREAQPEEPAIWTLSVGPDGALKGASVRSKSQFQQQQQQQAKSDSAAAKPAGQ